MKTVRDKMIRENVPIEQCQEGDHIHIAKGIRSSYNWGYFIIVKIKSLPKKLVQVKYKGTYKTSTVQKGVIPAGTIVERTRKWIASDGPDKGYVPQEIRDPIRVPSMNTSKQEIEDRLPTLMTSPDAFSDLSLVEGIMGMVMFRVGISLVPDMGKPYLPQQEQISSEPMKNITPKFLTKE